LNVIVVRGDMDLGWDCGIARGKSGKSEVDYPEVEGEMPK